MANQMIALQARAPQGDPLGGAIRNNAALINQMSQQAAAQRQAQMAQQQMQLAQAKEARDAALAVPQLDEARSKAFSAEQKTILDFFDLAAAGMKIARGPEDARKIGDFLKNEFNGTALVDVVDQTLSSLPDDPNLFEPWRMQTLNQSLDAKSQTEQEFTTQNLGTSTRVLATPKFAGSPGGGASRVVSGSEAEVAFKPVVVNVEGIGPLVVDPNTSNAYPAAAGPTGGYTRPGTKSVGGGIPAGRGGASSALTTNPGALKDGAFAKSQPGYAGASGQFATFDTPEAGIAAQENLLRSAYVSKGFNTINKIVDRYAPQGPENSAASVSNYKKYLAERTGINIDAPVSAAQIPIVAAAMREFETGNRPGAGEDKGSAPQTVQQAANTAGREKIAKQFLDVTGVNFSTGEDPVNALIRGSTSGGAEQMGASVKAFIPEQFGGGATSGMENIQALKVVKATLLTALAPGGRLSTGISNEDRRSMESQLANIDDPSVPASARLRGWLEVLRIMRSYLGSAAPSRGGVGAGQRQVTRTGKTRDGRTVREYSDGSIEYGR
jgi:hypothetical protein